MTIVSEINVSAGNEDVVARMAELPDEVLFGENPGVDPKDGQERVEVEEPADVTEGAEEAGDGDKNKDDATADKSGDDPEFEIADPKAPDGKTTVKLSELVEIHREFSQFREQRNEILDREEVRVREHSHARLTQIEQAAHAVSLQLQAALQYVQPPQPPPIEMLDPQSQRYNPDQYHLMRAQYEQRAQLHQGALQQAQHFANQAQAAAAAREHQQSEAELGRLMRVWPTFADEAPEIVQRAERHYGLTYEELDRAVTDHRQMMVLRDALAYREMTSKGGKLEAKVVAKAPAKAAPQAGQQGRKLSREEAQYMQARKQLKESGGKDRTAARRAFEKFV